MDLTAIVKLTKDQKAAAATLGTAEARFMVDTYYQLQHERITAANRLRAATEAEEPNELLGWWQAQSEAAENQIKLALKRYAEATPWGRWAMSQKGIGPVITAGMVSRLELRPTVGHWWSFAGLEPTTKWAKGEKRPWNAALKRICWLAGESFVKVSGYDDAYYGKVYRDRKALEIARNEAGAFADQAAAALEKKRFGADTQARAHYEAGKLPPAHIHARATRYAVKLFLSHLHHVWHESATGAPPPNPYPIAILGHAHMLPPPAMGEAA